MLYEMRNRGFFGAHTQAVLSPHYMIVSLIVVAVFLGIVFIWALLRKRREAAFALGEVKTEGGGRWEIIPPGSSSNPTSLNDIAGIDEVVNEIRELVDFLKYPEKYKKLGARMPRGYLLHGAPGTGKTMLARAIANECGVHFITATGSNFVNKYVGVGANNVRDFFREAKKVSPAIAFIDEIDSLGREREGGNNHEEHDHCLNQLLACMDGFHQNDNVVIIGATNNYSLLDKALLRPGRFDRHISMPIPDINGREAIFKVHTRKKPVSDGVDFRHLSTLTFGFTGAQIESICNEAAIVAASRDGEEITSSDFMSGIDRVVVGLKQAREITPNAREIIACHESGHAILGYLGGFKTTGKITILARGNALGYVLSARENDDPIEKEEEMYATLRQVLGGRAAEEVYANTRTSGAASDLEYATSLARNMVYRFGLGDTLMQSRDISASKDKNADKILQKSFAQAKAILVHYRQVLDGLTSELLKRETLEKDEFVKTIEHLLAKAELPNRYDLNALQVSV